MNLWQRLLSTDDVRWKAELQWWRAILKHFVLPITALMFLPVIILTSIPGFPKDGPWGEVTITTALILTNLAIIRGFYRGGMLSKSFPKYIYNRILFGFAVFGFVFTLCVFAALGLQAG